MLAGCSGVRLEETAIDADGEEESCVLTGDPNHVGGPTRDPGWACGGPEPAPFPVGPAF